MNPHYLPQIQRHVVKSAAEVIIMHHLVSLLVGFENGGHFQGPSSVGTPVRVLSHVLLVVQQHLASADQLTHQVHARCLQILGTKILEWENQNSCYGIGIKEWDLEIMVSNCYLILLK